MNDVLLRSGIKVIAARVLLSSRIDRVLRAVSAETDGGDECPVHIIGSVESRLVEDQPPIYRFDFLGKFYDLRLRQLRHNLYCLFVERPELAGIKILPGIKPIFAIFATIGASSADGGLVFINCAR